MPIIKKSSEAAKSAFASILEVEGVLQSIEEIANKFGVVDDNGKARPNQAEIKLADAVILQMEEGVEEPDLKDGVYTFWLNYAAPGGKPGKRSFFTKGFMASAEKLDATRRGVKEEEGLWENLVGTRIRLVKEEVFLFTLKAKPGSDEKDEDKTSFNFVVKECGDAAEGGIAEYLTKLIDGKTSGNVVRILATDGRAKRHPEYKDAAMNKTLDKMLPVTLGEDSIYRATPAG